MEKFEGKSVFNGVASGKIKILDKKTSQVVQRQIEDPALEKQRFEEAREKARLQLKELYDKAVQDVGVESAGIFEIHQMMLEDMDYLDSVYEIIEHQKYNAEYAVSLTADNFSAIFEMMDDEYMKARAVDVKDISERMIHILNDHEKDSFKLLEPSVILAEDLTPSETIQLEKSMVLAFVTTKGSTNSHTAILARMMSIPALVSTNLDLLEEYDGKEAIVNGNTGEFIIEPDREQLVETKKRMEIEKKKFESLQALKGKESITKDGRKIKVYANIGNVSDIEDVLENDAEGIGLFRSEFIYLESHAYPSEEEQFQIYKKAAEMMNGKLLIVRTLDIGADKQVDYFELDKEENPAMGYRAIRICLDRKDVFITQLRALYRASAYGNIAIMFPMIISVSEVQEIKNIAKAVVEELTKEQIATKKVDLGIMIETPAAVMISDKLAKEVDFFSIGTNDLTQYTLAIDRQNQKLDHIYDSHHEAVLRMIDMVVKNAHAEGIWVGICGELAADLELTERFVQMGIDELSVAAPFVLRLREQIRNMNYQDGSTPNGKE